MTKVEFEQGYITRSKITKELYDKNLVTLACHCGETVCDGWAAIHNDEDSIKDHNDLYSDASHRNLTPPHRG